MTRPCAGSIIRGMRRLEELLRQMMQAAKAIGIDLESKFEEGVRLIKRDIVFAASLYLKWSFIIYNILKEASTINLEFLYKIDLFVYYGRALHYLELKKN